MAVEQQEVNAKQQELVAYRDFMNSVMASVEDILDLDSTLKADGTLVTTGLPSVPDASSVVDWLNGYRRQNPDVSLVHATIALLQALERCARRTLRAATQEPQL